MNKPIYERKDFDFSKWGAFFAFGQKQFDEQKEDGVKYVSLGAGLLARKDNAKEMLKALKQFSKDERQRELDIKGKDGIIRYELDNHEAFYTSDIDATVEAVEGYGITREEVRKVYNQERDKRNSVDVKG